MKNETKYPLKDKPLRYVAQSADERLEDLFHDKILMYYLAACGFALLIFYEWNLDQDDSLRIFKRLSRKGAAD